MSKVEELGNQITNNQSASLNKKYETIIEKLSKLDTFVKSKNDIAGLDSIINNCEFQIFKHH